MKTNSLYIACLLIVAISLSAQESAEVVYGDNSKAGSYKNINGIKLYYEVYGNGEPIVLLHGNSDSISRMSAQIKYFSNDYQVFAVDSRGHGKSEFGNKQLTHRQMADDIAVLLEKEGVQKSSIIGWSDGGIVGLHLAISYPEKVDKLIVFGANINGITGREHKWVHAIDRKQKEKIEQKIAEKDTTKDWRKEKILFELMTGQPGIDESDLNKIKSPVLVMAGDRDFISDEHTLLIYRSIQKSHLAILPGETHFAPRTSSDLFNQMVERFLENTFSRPDSRDFIE